MPELSTLLPPDIETRSEKERREALRKRRQREVQARQGFLAEIGLAAMDTNLTAAIGPPDKRFDPDPDFIGLAGLSQQEQKEIIEGPPGHPAIPPDLLPRLEGAVSLPHLRHKAEQTRRLIQRRQTLAEGGGSAVAAQIVAPIIDPAAFTLEAGVGGIAHGAVGAVRGGRAARIGGAAATGAGVEAGVEGAIIADEPDRGMTDITIAALGGAVFGGIGGGIAEGLATRRMRALKKPHRLLRLAQRAEEGRELEPTTARLAKGTLTRSERREYLQGVANRMGLGDEDLDELGVRQAIERGDIDAVVERMGVAPEPRAGEDPFGNFVPDDAEAEAATITVPGEFSPSRQELRTFTKREVNELIERRINELPRPLDEAKTRLETLERDTEATQLAISPERFDGLSPQNKRAIRQAGFAVDEEVADAVQDVIGERLYEQAIEEALGGGQRARIERLIDEAMRRPDDFDSETVLAAFLRQQFEGDADAGNIRRGMVGVNPNDLPTGDSVRIAGEEFAVEARDGRKVLSGEDVRLRADELDSIPADRDSIPDDVPRFPLGERAAVGQDIPPRPGQQVTLRDGRSGTATEVKGADLTIETSREIEEAPLDLVEDTGPPPPRQPAGAAAEGEPTPPPPKKGTDLFLVGNLTDAVPRYVGVATSMFSRLGKSPSRTARMLANALVGDPVSKAEGVQRLAADEWVMREVQRYFGRFNTVNDAAFSRWAARHDKRMEWGAKDEFAEEVGRAVRRPKGQYTTDPDVNASADHMRDLLAEQLQMAQRHRVRGLEEVGTDPTFLPRLYSPESIDRIVREINEAGGQGEEAVRELMSTALLNAQPELDPDLAPTIARIMLRKIREVDYADPNAVRGLVGRDRAIIRDWLSEAREEGTLDASDEMIEQIVRSFVRDRETSQRLTNRAKPRAAMDETTRITVQTDAGRRELAIEDITNNNAIDVMNLYTKQIAGSSAQSEVLRAFSAEFGRPVESFRQVFDQAKRELKEAGMADTDIQTRLKDMEVLRKAVAGERLGNNDRAAAVMRGLQHLNHLRVATKFGVAQLPEFGVVVSQAGLGATFRQIPEMWKIIKQARTGAMSQETLKEVQHIFGVGFTRANEQITMRMDDADMMNLPGGGRFERGLRRGVRAVNLLSGMASIHDMQTTMAARLALQKFTDIVYSRGGVSNTRLRQLGLTREMVEQRIAPQLQKHSDTQRGLLGVNFRNANFEQWDDQEAAAMLIGAVTRFTSQNVQQSRVGLMSRWMTTDVGRTVMQFRSFTHQAWRSQLMREVDAHDFATAVRVGLGGGIAALAFAAQTQVESAGRKDRDEFLKEELSIGNLAAVSFERNGMSSYLPTAMDMGAHFLGAEPIFNNRNSMLARRPIDFAANPTTDLISGVQQTTSQGVQALTGQSPFSDQDLRRAQMLLPFGRMLGVEQIFNAMGSQLPGEN